MVDAMEQLEQSSLHLQIFRVSTPFSLLGWVDVRGELQKDTIVICILSQVGLVYLGGWALLTFFRWTQPDPKDDTKEYRTVSADLPYEHPQTDSWGAASW